MATTLSDQFASALRILDARVRTLIETDPDLAREFFDAAHRCLDEAHVDRARELQKEADAQKRSARHLRLATSNPRR